jgi:hypothetical protein
LYEDPFPSWWEDDSWLISVLDIGIDEGGAKNTLLTSAQFGSTASMRRVNRLWKKALNESGVTFFHSKDFGNFDHGVFAGLSSSARRRLLKYLARLIQKYACAGITASLDIDLYQSETTPEFRSKWGTAYSFAIQMTLLAVYLHLKSIRREQEGVNILIARGHRNEGQVMVQLQEIKEGNPYLNVKTCGTASMRDFGILQAADMMAYGIWQLRSDGDLEIFNALRASRKEQYTIATLNLGLELINSIKRGVDVYTAARNAWGQRNLNKRDDPA